MRLPVSNDQIQREAFRILERADKDNYKRNQDIEVGENFLILTSPNGTRYSVVVDDAGNLSTEVL